MIFLKPGYTANVDWLNGTSFGNALATSLVEKAWYKDLNRIVTHVCIFKTFKQLGHAMQYKATSYTILHMNKAFLIHFEGKGMKHDIYYIIF